MERLRAKKSREQSLVRMLERYNNDVHSVGERLPKSVRVYRLKVLRCFMKAGVPCHKVDCFRDILEENSLRLSSRSHFAEMIPIVRPEEEMKLCKEFDGEDISIVFDGTKHVCEAMVIVVRFFDQDWCIQQQVVRMMLLVKSLTEEEVARQLIVTLSTELGIVDGRLVAAMHDRAAVVGVAIRTLNVIYPSLIDVDCFSQPLSYVGDKFNTPTLDHFFKLWIGMFPKSPKTKLAWKARTDLPAPTYSVTRWWSKRKVLHNLHDAFGDVYTFLQDTELPPSRLTLLAILDNDPERRKLCMELAAIIDADEPLVKATYQLEGDGPLAFTAYKEISFIQHTIANKHYPNVDAVAKQLSSTPQQLSQLLSYAAACVQPAHDYFATKFGTELAQMLDIFKLLYFRCKVFHPS